MSGIASDARAAAAQWSRRSAILGLTAGAAACATLSPEPVLSVNLADLQPQAPPDTGTRLHTAVDEAARMMVPVYLDRRGPFQFVVDTGANRTVVALETAMTCGMASAGSAEVHGIAGVQPAGLVKVPRLRVGAVRAGGLTAPALPKAALGADGLLGVDVLRGKRVRLDFGRNTFEIGPSRHGASVARAVDSRIRRPDEGVTVHAHYRAGQLVIFDAEVAGVPVRAFLDSGSQVTVGNAPLRDLLMREKPELLGRASSTHLVSATGQTAPATLASLPMLRLGGVMIQNLRAAFAPLHIFELWELDDQPSILVGVDVLRHFDEVTLDFGRRQITFVGRSA